MMTSRTIEAQRDFYKSELIQMGYFKTPEGLQLYELSLTQLEEIYKEVKSQVKNVERCRTNNDLFS
ncbi:Fur-regulated basic protein FbpA [Bacillus paramycoides]|uniref:Fur-regulated basic protein FbpA n=1 Tax=Bacillus paramycoides TaxID=2026194 RepID=UPI004059CA57